MIRSTPPSREQIAAVRRVKEWTRSRFSLDDAVVIFVAEVACGLPGCPPLETVVTFWTGPDRRHAFKVFKATVDVVEDDLPPAFMKDAIVADNDDAFCC